MFYHLSLFFNERELSLAYALMLMALSMSQVIGGPIAGGLQYLEGKSGLHGWQWLFIIEGVLTVLWGCAIPVSCPSHSCKNQAWSTLSTGTKHGTIRPHKTTVPLRCLGSALQCLSVPLKQTLNLALYR